MNHNYPLMNKNNHQRESYKLKLVRHKRMPTPTKQLPGQQTINGFLQPMHRSQVWKQSPKTLRQQDDQQPASPDTSPSTAAPLTRRRRIVESDDDDGDQTITPKKPQSSDIILVPDSADESDPNFTVMLLPSISQQLPQTNPSTPPVSAEKPKPRRRQRMRLSPQPADEKDKHQDPPQAQVI